MRLIWATRGRDWGYRFLLNGGESDPLAVYEAAFAGHEGDGTVCQRTGDRVALRFADPEGRCDRAGRTITHDVVVLDPPASLATVEEGRALVWPAVADRFAHIWDRPDP